MVNTIDDDYRLPERIRRGDGLESLHDTNCDNSRLRSENNAKRRVMRTDEAFKILRNAAWLGSNEERDAIEEAVAMACNALANIEQITWERDTAIDQLRMLGYSLGEKPRKNGDLISRQAAIDIERNATVDTNPSHFEAHQKFTQFMDDAEISSFGRWQWSNGFNTALTAVGIDLKKLPSAQPEQPERCSDCEWWTNQPEIIRCKDCKHFHYDMPYVVQGIPVLGHEVCDFWGDGCKTNENGFCSFAERKESEGEG